MTCVLLSIAAVWIGIFSGGLVDLIDGWNWNSVVSWVFGVYLLIGVVVAYLVTEPGRWKYAPFGALLWPAVVYKIVKDIRG